MKKSRPGKRYVCEVCGTQILCIKAGMQLPKCCDQTMTVVETKIIGSSD